MAFLKSTVMLALLVFNFVFVSEGQRIITAEPGDNVILTCGAAENKDVRVVEWRRTDLESDHYVLLYRDSQSDPEGQPPSFINRVSLLDVENGDVSLVLKDVKTNDTGTYECRVVQEGKNRRKRSLLKTEPICIINLRVEPGNQEDGGNKDGLKEDGGSCTGWIGGFIVLAIAFILLAAVGVVLLCKRQKYSLPSPETPPAPEDEPLQDTPGL